MADQLASGEVAGAFVEPIQSDGGLIWPPAGFLTGLRRLTEDHGALLIIDEVKVGLGRTGHLLSHHKEEIVPDVVTLGKARAAALRSPRRLVLLRFGTVPVPQR